MTAKEYSSWLKNLSYVDISSSLLSRRVAVEAIIADRFDHADLLSQLSKLPYQTTQLATPDRTGRPIKLKASATSGCWLIHA